MLDHDETGPFVSIAAAAANRHGVVTTAELTGAGLSSSAISRWARSGLIERLSRGVYRLCGTPDSWHQRLLAATLAGPPGTVASHRSAAALHGFRGFGRVQIEVSSTRWRRATIPSVLVHESLAVPSEDATTVDGIATTSAVRTLVDLGAVAHPFKIGQALDEARRRGQVELRAVGEKLESLAVQGRNGIVAVRTLLDERGGVPLASTGFEQLLIGLVDAFRLPRPTAQHRVTVNGADFFLDFAYATELVAIEMDSEEFHLDLEQFHRDRDRQNRLVLEGWRFLRFTTRHVRRERTLVAKQIASALGLHSPTQFPPARASS